MGDNLCDLCGDIVGNADDRYCRTCMTDPYRRIVWQIHEIIGHDDYTARWIHSLNEQIAKLKKSLTAGDGKEE